MKNFKAIVAAKKSHPENPQDLVFFSNKHNTAKGFADEIKALLEEEDENASFWFAPKVEKISEEEFNASQIDLGQIDEQSGDPEINYTAIAQDEVPETNKQVGDSFYWFQYTKNNPIVIKLSQLRDHIVASYKFESDLFLEIDKQFQKAENAIIFALGLVIDDCLSSPSQEHNAIIKAIGNRNENAISEALMTPEDVAKIFDTIEEACGGFNSCGACPSCKTADSVKPWENNPEITHPNLYGAIVDINTQYKGEKVPAASDCYQSILASVPEDLRDHDDLENKLIEAIADIKNPHNFTNGAAATQIVMRAFPQTNHTLQKPEAMQRLSARFSDNPELVKGEQKEPEKLPETKISEQITQDSGQIDDLGFEFGDDKKAEIEDLIDRNFSDLPTVPEKSDFEKSVDLFNEKINALEIGELITFDDMPNEVYHACDGISSSQIKDAMLSMMYFNAKYNTKEIERTGGSHFDIGNVFHSICLEPDLTSKEYICEPQGDDVPDKPSDAQLEKYNAWLKLGSPEKKENPKAYPTDLVFERCGYWGDWYAENSGLCPVDADDWKIAEAMANSALNDEDSSKILRHPARRCEVSYFKRCGTTGMIIKARPDIELGRIVGDLKSISLRGQFDEKYLISALRKEVFNRNYHLSAAMYLDITGKDQFLWIFTNKQKGYHWTATVRASSEILERGRELYAEYKQKIADSYNSGKWAKPESIQSKRNASDKIELPEI